MKEISGGCCAAKGFSASGVHCGIRKNKAKRDLALIVASCECSAAAVYTTNFVKAAPVYITQKNLSNGKARAIIVNSGNANACARNGEKNALMECNALAKELGISTEDIIINSTGVIGVELPVDCIVDAVPELVKNISADGSDFAAEAIMTTDTIKKQIAIETEIDGKKVVIGGISKGSGMIHPNMATMLGFITTDCSITPQMLQLALSKANAVTFNRITVDGDTSTNDMVAVLASGLAENCLIEEENASFDEFTKCLTFVCKSLAKMIAKDGEGATKLICCNVTGASSEKDAETLAKSVVGSSLVKAAMFGADANWGREICAMGYSGVQFGKVEISFESKKGKIVVCKDSLGVDFDEDIAKEVLMDDEITIACSLNDGDGQAEAYGCDLTYDYVKINGDYRT